jgi:hypothetical protein
MGIEPTTYSLGSYRVCCQIKEMLAKPNMFHANRIK